jgi:hypothetical protein
MATANVKHTKICAFCKYWYDPTNQHIKPKNPMGGFWEFDDKAVCKCLMLSLPKRANASCPKYEAKVPVPNKK